MERLYCLLRIFSRPKYTSPSKLIGNGVSMGGVLIGRAITERPDLFAVAIAEVGLTNAIRSETTANGSNQIPEIGTLKNKEDTKNLLEMDAQSKVKKGVKYPAVLVRTGMNDSRIVPWGLENLQQYCSKTQLQANLYYYMQTTKTDTLQATRMLFSENMQISTLLPYGR